MNQKELRLLLCIFMFGCILLSCEKDRSSVVDTDKAHPIDKAKQELVLKYTNNIVKSTSFQDALNILNQNIEAVNEPIQVSINTDQDFISPTETPDFNSQESVLYNWALDINNQNNGFEGLTEEEIQLVLENAFAVEPLPSPPKLSSLSQNCSAAFTERWNRNASTYRSNVFICFLRAIRGDRASGVPCVTALFFQLDYMQRQAFDAYQECMRQKMKSNGYGATLFSFLGVNEFSSDEFIILTKQRLRKYNDIIEPAIADGYYTSGEIASVVDDYIQSSGIYLSVYERNDLNSYMTLVYDEDFRLPLAWAEALYDIKVVRTTANGTPVINKSCYGIRIQENVLIDYSLPFDPVIDTIIH